MVTLWLFEVGYGHTYLMVKIESDRIPQVGEKIDTKECKWCERVDVMVSYQRLKCVGFRRR